MKVINFRSFRELPVCARVMWIIAAILAFAGIGTMCLSMLEIVDIELCVSLALCVASQIITTIGLRDYKDLMYKRIGR